MTRFTRKHFWAWAAAGALLAGCGANLEQRPAPDLSTPGFERALRVQLKPGDSVEAVERRYQGEVEVWNPGAGFAVLGVSAAGQGAGEPNQDVFLASGRAAWMNGQSGLWSGGQSGLWAGGQSGLWSGGESGLWSGGAYLLFPQNTDAWRRVGLDKAQALAPGLGRGVKVAVIDTGVDLEHPMIRTSLVPEAERWDFVGDDPVPQEEGTLGMGGYGHGTSVAGIVLQVAPGAKIMPLRVLGPDGRGDVLDLAAALDWAVRKGAQVINLSLGSSEPSPAVEAALQAATAQGVLVVSSVGNTADTAVSYPASAARLENGLQRLSVTSIRADLEKSDFANYGESVEIAAPGEAVLGPAPGGRVAAWSGTSMAAPVASGALALALAEPLAVLAQDLAEELTQTASGEIYNNDSNLNFRDQVGKGSLDLEAFLNNAVRR